MGDMNARMGNEQVLENDIVCDMANIYSARRSKDTTFNSNGKQLLNIIEDIGGIIVNGRVDGDTEGEYSFCGVMGNSIIDYCICSYNFLSYIKELTIPPKIYSDHMPLCLHMQIPTSTFSDSNKSQNRLYWKNSLKTPYCQNLNNLLRDQSEVINISVDSMLEKVTNAIKQAQPKKFHKKFFEPKQRWFDWSCYRARATMKKRLKLCRRVNTDVNRRLYYLARNKYKQLCDRKKLECSNNTLKKLDNIKCSKQWWDISKSLKQKDVKVKCNIDADDFKIYFSNLLSNADVTHDISWCMPFFLDPFLDSPFEYRELYSVVRKLKSNKSPGQDGIPYEFYRHAPRNFLLNLLRVFNSIFLKEDIPSSFTESILIPLHKKGDVNVPSNYRGLSLIDSICKIFNMVLLNRISDWLTTNNILNEFQAGFRKDYSTVDNIFNLVSIVSLNQVNNKVTYAFFVDFSSAFDLIPRNSLFYKLTALGLSTKMVSIIKLLYKNTKTRVWDGNTYSDYFSVQSGVKQGCILSPILFSLYVNDLPNVLPGGVNVANCCIKILLYADDIVLLADSPKELQKMINALEQYCFQWSLKVNLAKSKIMVFRKGTRVPANLNFYYNSQVIEIVNNYKYLGVDVAYNLSFKKHLRNKLSASKIAINSSWSNYIKNPKISHLNKLKIFESCSKSIMCYADQIWGYERYDDVEKLFRFFIKRMLYLPNNTPNYMLHLETGLHSLFSSTLKSHLIYINKILKLSSHRLPKILALEILEKNISWAKVWSELCQDLNLHPTNNGLPLCIYWKEIIVALNRKENLDFTSAAKNSQFHDLYSQLNYDVIPKLLSNFSGRASSLIIKARGGLLDLNSKAFRNSYGDICSICNTNEKENTFHFIGYCPIFNEFRKIYFNKITLNINETLNVLNGTNLSSLYLYLERCINYRKLIINNFNE
ncbi:uncharacterized protein [Musca autumnalis]|uniref:uncharacterized protein n=1 Tax=Musca autumnalis TaxID=221902 RepID=UPI003CF3153B